LAIATGFKDPITFEVFKNALVGLADEMGLVTFRTGHSPGINQALDFSTAVCGPDGQVLAQGMGMMIHLGTYPDAMAVVLKKYRGRIYPGDVYIFNDMDEAAQHLNDLYVVKPCFMGDELIGFGMSTAHHVDIGGSVPGSMNIAASEIFQDGLQIPLVKLYERGQPNEAVFDIVMRNVRLPALYAGDLEGQVAALHAGEVGLVALVRRYGLTGFRELSQELLEYTERLTRAAIERIPDGTYEFEDWNDDDGVSIDHDPLPFRVKIIVSGDSITVDWEGTGRQVESSINVHITNTRSVTYGVLMGAFQNEIPSNSGFYRPITIRAPEGSIVNAQRPAARGLRGIGSCYRMISTLLGALHKAVPDRIPAGDDGGVTLMSMTVDEPGRGRVPVLFSSPVSGWGGRPGLDGIDGISSFGANTAFRSAESTEQEGRLRVEWCGYVPDTGGPGQWRGCLSVGTDFRILVDEALVRLRRPRQKVMSYGLEGGMPGTPSSSILNPGRPDERVLPQIATLKVKAQDVLRYVHSSGGGYGDPFLRDPQAVLTDVLDAKFTVEYAKREYGVAIDLEGGFVDQKGTTLLRASH
jgi:N-methylhydantoinase B